MKLKASLLAILLCCLLVEALSATIFDKRTTARRTGAKNFPVANKFKRLDGDHSKRHINTFRVLDSGEKHKLAQRMEKKTQKFNDDTSNERMIWRSHPQKEDFSGPDTDSVAGLGIFT